MSTLIIAVVLVVAVCYVTLLHPTKLDCVTYKRLPAIQDMSTGPAPAFLCYSVVPVDVVSAR